MANSALLLFSLELPKLLKHCLDIESQTFEVRSMLHAHARRGRPKGTGIDDSDRIACLAELLRIRPDMRPTTAIRLMGYSDPSAIRRLRDKYKVFARTARNTLLGSFKASVGGIPAVSSDAAGAAIPSTQLR